MDIEETNFVNVLELFSDKKLVHICAPMVRYSKLQFRNLVKLYDCDLCFTSMILADSFCKSEKARLNEFTTNSYDIPLITQLAANTVHDFVGASYLVSPHCNGVDLNCGCPQRWASQQGLGCSLLKSPQLIYDMVRQCRNQIAKPFTISVKMRILPNLRDTLQICKQLEMCDISFLSVHARTPSELTGDINKNALKMICEDSNVPVVANGGIKNLNDCLQLKSDTNCNGVMSANGILTNPTLFTGSEITTVDCIQHWIDICYNSTILQEQYETIDRLSYKIPEKPSNLTFQCFHHHLVFMLEKLLPRKEKQIFNNLQTFCDVLNYIECYFNIKPRLYDVEKYNKTRINKLNYTGRDLIYNNLKPNNTDCSWNLYDVNKSDGKFYHSKVDEINENECDWSNLFLEKD